MGEVLRWYIHALADSFAYAKKYQHPSISGRERERERGGSGRGWAKLGHGLLGLLSWEEGREEEKG